MLSWPLKDPGELLDYDIDWSLRLAGDTIVTSAWSFVSTDGALIITAQSNLPTRTKAWLSGGTANVRYELTNTITTLNGDTMLEHVLLQVCTR